MTSTKEKAYADYLIGNQNSLRSFVLQMPYRFHLRSLNLGTTLDIGCGAGRNLAVLNATSIGIDHNPLLVEACTHRKLTAMTTESFSLLMGEKFIQYFDSILISHVAEHMNISEFSDLLQHYKIVLKTGGTIIVICPQEKGFASDSTHTCFMDFKTVSKSLRQAGFKLKSNYSFPLPRCFGKVFTHNEFVVRASK